MRYANMHFSLGVDYETNSTGFVLVFETGYDGVLPFSIIIAAFTVAFLPSGKSSGPLMFLLWMQKEIAT